MEQISLCIRVYGIVQGVGFRPTVSRHAASCGVGGTVCNKGPYVEIYASGEKTALNDFVNKIEYEPPERAVILKIDVEELAEFIAFSDFTITESEKESGDILIPPDIAICEECKKELYDKGNRRYLHPFINCTCCGPRLTILDALPYDRERTSMKAFPMCPECEEEYHSPKSRRYDAQPVCCNDCGPSVYLLGREEKGSEAITKARKVLCEGGVIAVKGIGGFHLCCDAKNEKAVLRMRSQKNRPMKPFAVMMKNIDVVKRECELTGEQEKVLTGHQKPIVLLKKKEESSISEAVAPQNPKTGVMLPYAPIQMLLFDYVDEYKVSDVLVMTSGNTSGAPICREEEDAFLELSDLCDVILSHDRKIRMRADDTVLDFYKGKEYMIRRSRGYAPLPNYVNALEGTKGQVLAMGGELKNSFCIGKDNLFYMSPYIGDMEDIRTVEALRESVERFCQMLEVSPKVVACDLHPRYNTTVVAEEYDARLIRVQHHYAHIVSCMAENDYMDSVIGVSFDGTGFGSDQTIWGGELLLSTCTDFTRMGHIAPFLQIGGDLAAKEGWRIAVSMIYGLSNSVDEAMSYVNQLQLCSEQQAKVLFSMYEKKMNAVLSTSAGRLFDAVSAILGIRKASTFEGEASTALQFAAEEFIEKAGQADLAELSRLTLAFEQLVESNKKDEEQVLIMPTDSLVKLILEERVKGTCPKMLAYFFHERLSNMIEKASMEIRMRTGNNTVALSGGCFQNLLLLRLCEEKLKGQQFHVLTHHLIPPNDGGIALGQAVVAMCTIEQETLLCDK